MSKKLEKLRGQLARTEAGAERLREKIRREEANPNLTLRLISMISDSGELSTSEIAKAFYMNDSFHSKAKARAIIHRVRKILVEERNKWLGNVRREADRHYTIVETREDAVQIMEFILGLHRTASSLYRQAMHTVGPMLPGAKRQYIKEMMDDISLLVVGEAEVEKKEAEEGENEDK